MIHGALYLFLIYYCESIIQYRFDLGSLCGVETSFIKNSLQCLKPRFLSFRCSHVTGKQTSKFLDLYVVEDGQQAIAEYLDKKSN